jgi:hypothetical protein
MSYKSLGIKKTDGFFDIIRLLDKIQYRKTSDHLMTSNDVKKALFLHEEARKMGNPVYTNFYSCYSITGYKFERWCSHLVLNPHGGFISWQVAPERQYGKGDRFTITIINPVKVPDDIVKLFPGFMRKESGATDHLILSGD